MHTYTAWMIGEDAINIHAENIDPKGSLLLCSWDFDESTLCSWAFDEGTLSDTIGLRIDQLMARERERQTVSRSAGRCGK